MEVRVKPDVIAELQVPAELSKECFWVSPDRMKVQRKRSKSYLVAVFGIINATSSGLSLTEIGAQLPTRVQVI
jgi:hypothetical protein